MEVKSLDWTPDHVQRFWDYWSERADGQATYFAAQVGKGVCKFLDSVRPVEGLRVLDYGAGPGYLVDQLLQRGASVAAVEYSPQSVADLNRRFRRERSWCSAQQFDGQRLPWPDGHFDLVVCLETIEHLLPDHLNPVLRELKRVLKPGGVMVCTTPNSENLRQQTVFCPHCCHEFHRWQHVRSWTPENLSDHLQQLGYQIEFCDGLNFHDFQPDRIRLRDLIKLRFWRNAGRHLWRQALDQMRPRPFPQGRGLQHVLTRSSRQHLVAVATKPAAASERTADVDRVAPTYARHAA